MASRLLLDISHNELTHWVFPFPIGPFFFFSLREWDFGGKGDNFFTALLLHFGSGVLRLRRARRFFAVMEILSYEQRVTKLLGSSFNSFCSLQGVEIFVT